MTTNTMTLTNDEREVILKMRESETLVNGRCEDYPCCGHTPDDPCTREWYDHPDAFNPQVNPHCFCEHEFGICDVDDRVDEDNFCDSCEEQMNYSTGTEGIDYVDWQERPKSRLHFVHPTCRQQAINRLHAEAICTCTCHTGDVTLTHADWNCECHD